jgi:phosphoribosylamine--glycine ligase
VRVLVVGSGGREHALAWRLAQSPEVDDILTAPGNSGTAALGENLPISDTDVSGLIEAAQTRGADLVVVGPEAPLVMGLVDQLALVGIPAFGTGQGASQLEASKSFARDVMESASVPGPHYRVFQTEAGALEYIATHDRPVVVKADGLAAGKGVAMCPTREVAQAAVRACMTERVFGESGDTVVIEDWIDGPEVSVFGFSDGENLSPVVAATDYKRIGEGGAGPNTGGMGSYGPPHFWSDELAEQIRSQFMVPVLREMSARGCAYRGAMYCGLMLTNAGPRVLEFNCRFGDPETQVIMPQLISDPVSAMMACAVGDLSDEPAVQWSMRPTVGVVMVSGGYPGPHNTGHIITGLDDGEQPETLVFHAGARWDADGAVRTAGGRVLTCVGSGDTVAQARSRAYRRVEAISYTDAYYRGDIAADVPVSAGTA